MAEMPLAAADALQDVGRFAELTRARDERMNKDGETYLRLRGQTVEPVHAQLRQHGLDRIHVRGLVRAGSVVTLACIAHNVMKWKAREEDARALREVA